MHSTQPEGSLLEAVGLTKHYERGGEKIAVLQGIDLQVCAGEMIAIVGFSGSGKTTLLQLLGTLDKADSGELYFCKHALHTCPEAELAQHRNRNIGFIFQFHHLLPEFTALENVMMPGIIHAGKKHGKDTRGSIEEKAVQLLEQVGLSHRLSHRSGELSGGEQQRVALARALIMNPRLLLADEPTGNLDSQSGHQVFSLLKELNQTMGLSTIMVTHNLELARQMDRCLTLQDGVLQTLSA